jgi:hypothetical protein
MTRRTYRQNPDTKEWVEVERGHRKETVGYASFESFVSPIDGRRVRNVKELTEHNRRHGVTNDIDSLREKGRRELNRKPNTGNKKERVAALVDAYDRVQSSGFSRRIKYDD